MPQSPEGGTRVHQGTQGLVSGGILHLDSHLVVVVNVMSHCKGNPVSLLISLLIQHRVPRLYKAAEVPDLNLRGKQTSEHSGSSQG